MATAVGALSIDLSLNSAAFIRDMGKSQKALSSNSARMHKALAKLNRGFFKLRRSLKRTAKGMISMRSVVATVAGAGGIGLLVKSSIDFADSIGKTADAIGITTGALQEYRFALDISGVATEKTDKGLKKFVRNMGELARSSSETQTALKDLDPALLDNLRSLDSVEDQLALGFRALAAYTSQSKRAAVAQALFGRSGVDMTVAIKNGIAAFEALRKKGVDLGIILDDKLIRNAERAKDELTILAQVIKVKVVGAVVAFAPQIADLAQKFADGIPAIVKWVEEFGRFIGLIKKQKSAGIAQIGAEIASINAEIVRLQENIAFFKNLPIEFDTSTQQKLVVDLRRQVAALRGEIEVLINLPIQAAAGAASRPATPAPTAGTSIVPTVKRNRFRPGHEDADLIASMQQAAAVRTALATAEFTTARAIAATTVEMNRQAGQTATLITATEQGTAAVAAQREIFDLNNAALAQGVDLTTQQGQAWEAAFRRNQIFNQGLEETRTRMETARAETERMADTITTVLDGAIAGNIQSWRDLGRVAIGVIGDILKEQLRAAAVAQAAGGGGGGGGILGSIFGAIGGLFGGGGGGLGPQFTGTDIRTSGSFAHGGRATVAGAGGTDSKLAMLRVSPGEDITVRTPAQQRAGGGGRGGDVVVNQTFDFRGAEPGVFARAQQFKEQIKAETVAAVFGLINQGGMEARVSGRRRTRR